VALEEALQEFPPETAERFRELDQGLGRLIRVWVPAWVCLCGWRYGPRKPIGVDRLILHRFSGREDAVARFARFHGDDLRQPPDGKPKRFLVVKCHMASVIVEIRRCVDRELRSRYVFLRTLRGRFVGYEAWQW